MSAPKLKSEFISERILNYDGFTFKLNTVKIQYGIRPHFELKLTIGYNCFFVKFSNTGSLRSKLNFLIKQHKTTNTNGRKRRR